MNVSFFRLPHKIPIGHCNVNKRVTVLTPKPLSNAKVLEYKGKSAVITNWWTYQKFLITNEGTKASSGCGCFASSKCCTSWASAYLTRLWILFNHLSNAKSIRKVNIKTIRHSNLLNRIVAWHDPFLMRNPEPETIIRFLSYCWQMVLWLRTTHTNHTAWKLRLKWPSE